MSAAIPKHDPYIALRFRNFRLLFLASTFSVIATGMQVTALGWELYERTRDPLVLGNVGLAEFLPVLLLALPAGHVADRFNRKAIAILSRLAEAIASLGLAYLSWTRGDMLLIYAVILVTSIARTFHGPVFGALLPQTVDASAFSNAVSWQMTSFHLASLFAPGLAAGLIALYEVSPLPATGTINPGATVSYAISGVILALIALLYILLEIKSNAASSSAATLADVLSGLRFVFLEKLVLSAITLDLFAVLFGGAVALLPVFAKDVLNVGPLGFYALRTAPAVGAILMALILTRMPPIRRSGRTLLIVVAGFGLATILFGISQNVVLSVIALALTGAFDNVSMVIRGALVPLRTPDAMRGRVSAVERVFISSSNELGAWESGLTASWWGAVPAVIVGGVGTLVVVTLVAFGFPQLRALGALDQIQPAEADGI